LPERLPAPPRGSLPLPVFPRSLPALWFTRSAFRGFNPRLSRLLFAFGGECGLGFSQACPPWEGIAQRPLQVAESLLDAAHVVPHSRSKVGHCSLDVREDKLTIGFRPAGYCRKVLGKLGQRSGHFNSSIFRLLLQIRQKSAASFAQSQDLIT